MLSNHETGGRSLLLAQKPSFVGKRLLHPTTVAAKMNTCDKLVMKFLRMAQARYVRVFHITAIIVILLSIRSDIRRTRFRVKPPS